MNLFNHLNNCREPDSVTIHNRWVLLEECVSVDFFLFFFLPIFQWPTRLRGLVYWNRFRVRILQIQRVAVHLRGIRSGIVNSFDVSEGIAHDSVRALANVRLPVRGATRLHDPRPIVRLNHAAAASDCVHRGRSIR